MDLKREMFIANGVHHLGKNDSWEYLPGIRATLKANARENLDTGGWHLALQGVQTLRRDAVRMPSGTMPSEASLFDRLLVWADDNYPGLMPLTDDVREALQRDSSIQIMRQNETGRAAYARGAVYETYAPQAEEILGEIYDISQKNPNAAKAWDRLMARDLGSVSASPEEIVKGNPELAPILTELKDSPSRDSAKQIVEKQVEVLTTKVTDAEATPLENGANKQANGYAALQEQAAESRRKQEEDIRRQTYEDALRGAIALYSLFGGDKKTVKQLNAVISAYSAIRTAVNTYNTAAAIGSSGAGLALAGQWVLVVVALAAAFEEDEGQNAQAQIMEALKSISQQLSEIQRQISKGFSYIDSRLLQQAQVLEAGFQSVLTGLLINQIQLRQIKLATYAFASNLDTSISWIAKKLDYVVDVQNLEKVSAFANWKQMTGSYLTLGDANANSAIVELSALRSRSLDEWHAGAELFDLSANLDYWLDSNAASELSNWVVHINTFRSICRLLKIAVPPKRVPNPAIWIHNSMSCMEIGANNLYPPSKLGPLLIPQLISDGELLTSEATLLRNPVFSGPNSADIVFAFLLQKYAEVIKEVINEVSLIHKDKLMIARNGSPADGLLGEFEELINYAAEGAVLTPADPDHEGWTLAKPSSKADAVMPFPSLVNAGGVDITDGVLQHFSATPGLDDCAPSWMHPEAWPEVRKLQAWEALSLEIRSLAITGSWLGLGKVSMEYQAQIEQFGFQDGGWYNIVGRPVVHYVLFLNSPATRLALSCASQYLADSHLGLVLCYTDSRFNLTNFGFKKNFANSCARPFMFLPPLQSPFVQLNDLQAKVRSRYCDIAEQIRVEIASQLGTTASELGAKAKTLSRVTELIRSMARWLLPDGLIANEALRTSLFGPTDGWLPWRSGWEPSKAMIVFPDLVIPLLDTAALQSMASLRSDQDPSDPTTWWATQLLSNLDLIATTSRQTFEKALKECNVATDASTIFPTEVAVLEQLKLHQRYF
jgi:hypothetical protein